MLAAQHRQAQEKLTQFVEFVKRQDDLFKEKVPDMADESFRSATTACSS